MKRLVREYIRADLITAEIELAHQTLQALLDHYVQLVESGDCGFWDPETESEVIAARALLTKNSESTPAVVGKPSVAAIAALAEDRGVKAEPLPDKGTFHARGKFGEPRKYSITDCPHDAQAETDSGDYFCSDCGLRSEGPSH